MGLALIVLSSAASAEDGKRFGNELMKEIRAKCLFYGQIVAEARLNKWEKEGKNVKKAFGTTEPYALISKIQQQQCVSVHTIQLLQEIKSVATTKDAAAWKIDEEIAEHMALIEKTL